ncbi:MAG: glycosyltransferase, partial [Candidatus Hecatellaceae archaeon]
SFHYWTWPDGAVDPWRTLKWLSGRLLLRFARQVAFEGKQIAGFSPDLVVSDTRLSTVVAAKALGKPVITVLNQFNVVAPGLIHYPKLFKISDLFSFGFIVPGWGLSDRIYIPDFPPPYTISRENLRVPPALQGKIRYVGPFLPVRPEELPSQEQLKVELGFNPEEPLIYISASGPTYERWWLSKIFMKIFSNPPRGYHAVLSLGRRELEGFTRRFEGLTVYGWIKHRFKMLKACDVLVGRSSHGTVTQALAYGKPLLLLPTQEQTEQLGNARTAVKLGVAKALDPRYLSKETFFPMLEEILSQKSFKAKAERMSRLAAKLGGAGEVVEEILSFLHS